MMCHGPANVAAKGLAHANPKPNGACLRRIARLIASCLYGVGVHTYGIQVRTHDHVTFHECPVQISVVFLRLWLSLASAAMGEPIPWDVALGVRPWEIIASFLCAKDQGSLAAGDFNTTYQTVLTLQDNVRFKIREDAEREAALEGFETWQPQPGETCYLCQPCDGSEWVPMEELRELAAEAAAERAAGVEEALLIHASSLKFEADLRRRMTSKPA